MINLEEEFDIIVLREKQRVSHPNLNGDDKCTNSHLLDDKDNGFGVDEETDDDEYCCEVCGNMYQSEQVTKWNNIVVCWFCLDDMNKYFGEVNYYGYTS